MPAPSVLELQIVDAFRHVPASHWLEVLDFVRSVGLWAGRSDLDDSQTFVRQLRERAERRGSADDHPR